MCLFFIKEVVILSCHFSGHFFNIPFDRTGNRNTNIENIGRFSCSYTPNLTANTCNEKNHYLLMKETVKLNHLSTPFKLDF